MNAKDQQSCIANRMNPLQNSWIPKQSPSELLGKYGHGLNILVSIPGHLDKGLTVPGAGQDQDNKLCLSLHSCLGFFGPSELRVDISIIYVHCKTSRKNQNHTKQFGVFCGLDSLC